MAEDVVATYRLRFKDLASRGLLKVTGLARGMNKALSNAAKGAGLLAVAGVAAAAKMATVFANRADEIAKFSREVDLSAESLQRLEFIANRQGASFDKVKSGVQKFTKSMGEFRAGTGSLKTVLDKVDPALGKQLLAIEDNSAALDFAVNALSKYTNVQKQAAVSAALFGRSGGASFQRIVDGGAEALAELNRQADAFRPPISAADLKIGEVFKDSLFNTQQVIASMGDRIGQKFLPIMIKLMDRFNEFIVANREIINSNIDLMFSRIGRFVSQIDFASLSARASEFMTRAKELGVVALGVVDKLGGFKNVILGIGGAFVAARVITTLGALAAILGGPVTLAVVGVVAAGALIVANWDKIRAKAEEMGIDVDAVFAFLQKSAKFAGKVIEFSISQLVLKVHALIAAFRVAKRVIPEIWDTISSAVRLKILAIRTMIADMVSALAAVASIAPGSAGGSGAALSALGNSIRPQTSAVQTAITPQLASQREELRVTVELDGQVRGANVEANVTTTSSRSRGGSNIPRGRQAMGSL